MGALHSLYNLADIGHRLFWSQERLALLRQAKLLRLLKYCYRQIPYYTEQFKKIGAEPEDFKTPEDFRGFPVLDKATIQERFKEILNPHVDQQDLIRYSSSGSTGIPLELWYHPAERQRMGFTMTRSFFFLGLRPWHRMGNITEPRHFSSKNRWYHRLGIMNEHFLSIFEDTERNLIELRNLDPHFLICFPSILMLIGKRMMEDHGPRLRPKLLFTIAEVLTSDYRQTIKDQWGTEPFDVYGANEVGTIAFQCFRKKGYHINADSVYVELMKGDRPAEIGERGEVVVTNLDVKVMPIIRYRVGDVAERIQGECPCGCKFPLLGSIAGRSDGFVVGAGGKLFSALEASLLLHPVQGVQHYRLVQKQPGRLLVEWVGKEDYSHPEKEITQLLKEKLGMETEIRTRRVEEILREKSGKIRSVISHLPHPFRDQAE